MQADSAPSETLAPCWCVGAAHAWEAATRGRNIGWQPMFSGTGAEVCAQARAEGLDVLEPTMDAFVGHLQEACSGFDPAAHTPAPLDKHGWMDPYIMRVFNKLDASRPILMVEVGSWKGQSSIAFAQRLQQLGPGHRLVCVDTWLGAPEFWTWGLRDRSRGGSLKPVHGWPTVYYTFLSNVHRSNVQDVVAPLPISSLQGALVLAHYSCQADAVYIDGSHEYEAVLADLLAYWPLLKRGGVCFGDDWCAEWPGVRAAVDEFAAQRGLEVEVHGIVWFVTKPEVDAPESRAAGSARHADARGCTTPAARGLATARMAALTLVCSFVLAGLWRRS
jgi:hypothetical protein